MVAHSKRQELVDKAMALWQQYGAEYRELPDRYQKLLDQKRKMIKNGKMRNRPLDGIRKGALKEEYPKIEFLDCKEEQEAKAYISRLSDNEIAHVIKEVEDFNKEAITKTLRAKVFDFKYQIDHCDVRKSIYALDPSACKGDGKHSHRRQLSYTGGLNVNEK